LGIAGVGRGLLPSVVGRAGLVLNVALLAITAFGNVPLNDDLAGSEATTQAAAVAAPLLRIASGHRLEAAPAVRVPVVHRAGEYRGVRNLSLRGSMPATAD
jgi:hypothetical protein